MEPIPFGKEIITGSPEETEKCAGKLYRMIAPDALGARYGPLGAGKTCFVRGLAREAGVDPDDVNSPSYTLLNEYNGGETPIYHFDLYRMVDPAEFISIGANDYLGGEGIILIEWAENGKGHIPEERFNVRFNIFGETSRKIVFSQSK